MAYEYNATESKIKRKLGKPGDLLPDDFTADDFKEFLTNENNIDWLDLSDVIKILNWCVTNGHLDVLKLLLEIPSFTFSFRKHSDLVLLCPLTVIGNADIEDVVLEVHLDKKDVVDFIKDYSNKESSTDYGSWD